MAQISEFRSASERWGAAAPSSGRDFYTFAPLVEHHSLAVTGRRSTDPDWLEKWICETQLPASVERCLSLCCGFGELERMLARRNFFRHCLALDLSPGAIAGAQSAATAEGISSIEYREADLNTASLPGAAFDVVWANGALHHIERLEHLLEQVYGALKPGGTLVAVEYVGPNHHRPTPRQEELINALLHVLPQRLRPSRWSIPISASRSEAIGHVLANEFMKGREGEKAGSSSGIGGLAKRILSTAGRLSGSVVRPRSSFGSLYRYDARYYTRIDPSEGVRASEVIPVVKRFFPSAEIRYFNGSLLAHVCSDAFFDNFDPSRDGPLLESMVAIESAAIANGEILSANAVIVARKPD